MLAILLFAAGLTGVLRSGYLISVWSFYKLVGIEAEAVIEQCEQYQYIVRKPRPSRYVSGYRGIYGFDLDASGNSAGHFTGRFDSRDFIDPAQEELRVGSSILVLHSRFDPSISRPADELNKTHLIISIVFFVPSLFALLSSIIFFYFNLSGSAWVDKNSEKITKKQTSTGSKEDPI
jgi:hypothetical protein